MRVKILDKKHGIVQVVPEDEDDLWILHTVITKDDLIQARTTREIKNEKQGSSHRIPMTIVLRVEYTEMQPFTRRLRVHGVIVEGPDRYGLKGSHHTLHVEPGTQITIMKPDGWSKPLLEKLVESQKRLPPLLILAIDYDEYAIGVLVKQGLNILVEKNLELPGKEDDTRARILEKKVSEIVELLYNYASRLGTNIVVIAGPGFVKQEVEKKLREKTRDLRIYLENTSMGGVIGLHEVLRRDTLRKVLSDYTSFVAEKILEEFYRLLASNPERIAYGIEEVKTASSLGAIQYLLVLDTLLRSPDEKTRKIVEEILEDTDKTRGKVYIVGSSSPVSTKLGQLGGIIAVLRYNLPKLEGQRGS